MIKMFRNSHWRCSIKKAVLKNLAIFIGKKPELESLFNKVVPTKVVPVNIANFLRTPILKNIYERLLLSVASNSNKEQHLLIKLDGMG